MSNRNDIQRQEYQVTLNNPDKHGYDTQKVMKIAVEGLTTLQYACVAKEIGKNGTPHLHGYLNCYSRVRFSTIKKLFPEAHIEVAKGGPKSNRDYIRKSGKWKDTEKAETSVEGSFIEWGKMPVKKGKRKELEELYQLVKEGYKISEILEYNNDYIQYIATINTLRTTLLIDEYKGKRRLNLEVIYISGATGTGKTRGVLDKWGDENVYRVTDYQHPFDGYECQAILAFDEFRSSLKISDMLNYCDVYPIQLPARYSNRYSCYTSVYIISNWDLEEQYKEVQTESPETWQAFLRRIKEVHIYKKEGIIIKYDSVEAYLKRSEDVHTLTQSEKEVCPFQQEELPFIEEDEKKMEGEKRNEKR